jgi:hypothetical protein
MGHALPIRSLLTSGVVARELPLVIYASRRKGFAESELSQAWKRAIHFSTTVGSARSMVVAATRSSAA